MAPLVRAAPLCVFHGCTDTVREDSISTLRGVRLPAQGLDFVLVDKDCECIVSTRSVRIVLIFLLDSSASVYGECEGLNPTYTIKLFFTLI